MERRSTRAAKAKKTEEEPAPAVTPPKRKQKAPPIMKAAKKRTQKMSANPPAKKKKTGLEEAPPPTATDDPPTASPLGVVDPEAGLNPKRASVLELDHAPTDAMLVLVDPNKHMDKYYVLQLLQLVIGKDDEDKSEHKDDTGNNHSSSKYIVYKRWGRTGSQGQRLLHEFPPTNEGYGQALESFSKTFEEKTGHAWIDRNKPTSSGTKYRFLAQDFHEKQGGFSSAKWQYWVDDGVDGKATDWYDYDPTASSLVERLYHEHAHNPEYSTRTVDSGVYTYSVDLSRMLQTNLKHENKTQRRIRRAPIFCTESPLLGVDTSVSGSTVAAGVAVATVTPVKSSPPVTNKTSATGKRPVDVDISVQGKSAANYTVVRDDDSGLWYDAVLNQCNISGNNNKYYRLQCLYDAVADSFYAWFRWGRVGEASRASSSTWSGPYANQEAAVKEFTKKYRAKTGNAWGSAETFVAKKNKYTLIAIDNDVDVSDDCKVTPQIQQQQVPVAYAKCTLDPPTKELIETLFSTDMRNAALASFNLDLKRLPLGVPSQQQIHLGIDILKTIEDKLAVGSSNTNDVSLEDMSSRFYTAIPHSFGRSRPPIINSKEALQSRYDMCNVLMDMYSTNETVRRVQEGEQEQQKGSEPTLLPNVVDQHYKSLDADLKWIDPQTAEYNVIATCFDQTKSQHSRSQLLHVWACNRSKEAGLFKAFEKVKNRHLLWHGTNIAVAAPIITSGLRIMPHSGGRVGSGIYLASMQEKSAQYTSGYGAKFACMFLCEAPLGKQHTVDSDGPHASSLRKAPVGTDSVHAIGRTQPMKWANMVLGSHTVKIAQGDVKPQPKHQHSSFHHDEFLLYEESQVRLRYVLTVKL